jgi:hypothetical protein
MFKSDLLSLFCRWKASGDEIILMGNFNENIYTGVLAASLAKDELHLSKMCYRTTGVMLLPTHTPGRVLIDAAFGTAGVSCTATALLPKWVGVGNQQVFIVDIASETILGNVFQRVSLIASWLLNCASNKITNQYILVLNQLSNRHLIFKKLLRIDRGSDCISPATVQLRMNRVDLELEQFMKSAKSESHKHKRDHIEWPPMLVY